MILRLYLKPGIIGLSFGNRDDREKFWSRLGAYQAGAERFGERTIRLTPANAKSGFSMAIQTDMKIESMNGDAKPVAPQPKPVENTIPAAAIRPPDPISPIATLPAEVLESPNVTVPVPVTAAIPEPTPEPPPSIAIPQVSSITQNDDPEPTGIHKNSRAYRAWKERQKK